MEMSGNRIWATGDPDNPYRVYFTGVGQYLGFFSPFYGGGYIDLEKGGRETPVRVVHYRKGSGDSMATVLCSSPDGLGSIWQVDINSNTVDNFTFAIPMAYKIVGSIGSNATFSVVKAKDNIGFANTKGVFFLRNKPQMLNILTTDETSQPIRPDYRSLNQSQIGNLCAYYYEGKIFFSASEGSTNDIIFIYDLERNNWTYKWSRGVKRFFEYLETKSYKMHIRVLLSKYRSYTTCESCDGARLKTDSLIWRVGSKEDADAVLSLDKRFMPKGTKWSR